MKTINAHYQDQEGQNQSQNENDQRTRPRSIDISFKRACLFRQSAIENTVEPGGRGKACSDTKICYFKLYTRSNQQN